MKKILFLIIFFGSLLYASTYNDALSSCMIKKTTPSELRDLKIWIFFAFSQDKDVKKYTHISKQDEDLINKKIAKYFTDLLINRCKPEFLNVVKYEGINAVSIAFEKLGINAGKEIMTSPEVQKFIAQFAKYINYNDFQNILK